MTEVSAEAVRTYVGWIGMADQIETYLNVVGADKDSNGRFKIYVPEDAEEGPVSFLGMGEEIVLRGTEEYSVEGHRNNLAAGLRSTSYGVGIRVF